MREIGHDEAQMANIRAAWDGFQQFMDADTPPPLSDGDTAVRQDVAWAEAARAFAVAKQASEAAAERLDAARAALVALARHPKESSAGVSVTRYWKAGSVDYKKIPQLKGVDLDAYRGRAREEVRVTAAA